MNENKHVPEEMIKNVEDEASRIIEEMIEEIENETSQIVEETIQDVEKGSTEEPVDHFALPAKAKKHVRAMLLVEQAKKILKESNKHADACKFLLETDLKKYDEAKSALEKGVLDTCVSLLKKLKYQTKEDDENFEEETVLIEPKEALQPMVIKDISSGKFTGFIYALLGGSATAVGMVYLATKKLDMTLNTTQLPSEDVIQSILAWFSTLLGLHEDVDIGAGILGVSVLLVMLLIYKIRVSLKAKCNLHFAVKQFVEAQMYTEQKPNCKVETDKIDAHINDAIETLKTYEVLLSEQQGKLQRILYIEGEKEKSTEYHDKSYSEMRDTTELIHAIKDFIHKPVLEEGKLSSKSVLYLQHAKDQMDKILARLY